VLILALVVVEFLSNFVIFEEIKVQNISRANFATWQQKLAADLSPLDVVTILKGHDSPLNIFRIMILIQNTDT